jgi:hypothetical protein
MVERYPWRAEIPLDALAATTFPKLAVSGGHSPGFEAVCDVLAERLGALRAVLPGEGMWCSGSESRSTRCWRRSSSGRKPGPTAQALFRSGSSAARRREIGFPTLTISST